jgi:hypothetical protein
MAGEDLFSGVAAHHLASRAPLAARMRPHTLDDIVGQRHLVGPGAPLRALIEADRLSCGALRAPARPPWPRWWRRPPPSTSSRSPL